MTYKTDQEEFWAGDFGDEYIDRNMDKKLLANNLAFFTEILNASGSVDCVMEFGANIGMNLKALSLLLPNAELKAIEINKKAAERLRKEMPRVKQKNQSILNSNFDEPKCSMVLCKGILIHINPEDLDRVYEKMYKCSSKYICIAEYFNPSPVKVEYRDYSDKLFKRDFAGDMLEKYSNLELIDYGFHYHRDSIFPQDDITWFLLRKNNN